MLTNVTITHTDKKFIVLLEHPWFTTNQNQPTKTNQPKPTNQSTNQNQPKPTQTNQYEYNMYLLFI
jgi:hypothetical protein